MNEENTARAASEPNNPLLRIYDGSDGRSLHLENVERWETPVHGAGLLDWIRDLVRKYLVLPPEAADTLALWVLHTYAFRLRRVTTYIGVVSPERQCGKTTLLTLLALLANRALLASNISPPAVFRVIEEAEPTLLIDEGDTFLKRKEELRGILNAGYTRESAYVIRVSNRKQGEGRSRLAKFSCWCPKVIAAIGRLPETLADRCIMVTMHRKMEDEQCERLEEFDATEVRRKCARLVEDQGETIRSWRPEAPRNLSDRALDIWEPLLVLAEMAGGEWPKRAREAAEKLSGGGQKASPMVTLLGHIEMLFLAAGCERLFTRTMVKALNELDEVRDLREGDTITEVWLSRRLRDYGIMSKTVWIGEESAKGYCREDFGELFGRYLPKAA